MDEKIIQKLEEVARRIRFGSIEAEFTINKGGVVKVIIKETREVILCGFDKEKKR